MRKAALLMVLLFVLVAILLVSTTGVTGSVQREGAGGSDMSDPDAGTARRLPAAGQCVTLTGLALSHAPTEAYTATGILFTAEIVTGSLPVTYTWAFGDGTAPLTGTTSVSVLTATHTFTIAGTYAAGLSAYNACTAPPARETVTVHIAACEAISATAMAHWPALPRPGQTVVFTATTLGGLPSPEFEWEFGDGGMAAGMVVTHTYSVPATYTVGLRAWNLCSQEVLTSGLTVLPSVEVYLPLILSGWEQPDLRAIGLGYASSIAACDHAFYLAEMGFDWAMGFVRWTDVGVGPSYRWVSVDDQLREFVPRVRHVVLRVHHPTPDGIGDPPVSAADLAAFRSFVQALAAYVATNWRSQGLETIAYEVWNEPNLSTEWGDPEDQVQPSAAQYTALLKAGYEGIRAGDPDAIVISAGLATTGGSLYAKAAASAAVVEWAQWFYGAEAVVPDLTFLRNMYLNGAKGYFDALGSHPYGGLDAPETAPSAATGPIYFRRAEEQRQVMLSFGDPRPIWATEFGWILETPCDLGPFEWMEVSETQQAQYLVDAYAYAEQHWPWMGPMVVFNLDFATVFYYEICEQMRYFSLAYRQDPQAGGPILTRLAFSSLRDMPKDSAW